MPQHNTTQCICECSFSPSRGAAVFFTQCKERESVCATLRVLNVKLMAYVILDIIDSRKFLTGFAMVECNCWCRYFRLSGTAWCTATRASIRLFTTTRRRISATVSATSYRDGHGAPVTARRRWAATCWPPHARRTTGYLPAVNAADFSQRSTKKTREAPMSSDQTSWQWAGFTAGLAWNALSWRLSHTLRMCSDYVWLGSVRKIFLSFNK